MKKLLLALLLLLLWPLSASAQFGGCPAGLCAPAATAVAPTWTPASLGTALIVWYKADTQSYSDSACTTPVTNTSNVACMLDQSGNGYTIKPSLNFNNPPTYNSTGLAGKPSIEVAGSSLAEGISTGTSGAISGKFTSAGSCFWGGSFQSGSAGLGPGLYESGYSPVTGTGSFGFGYTNGGAPNFSGVYSFNTLAAQTASINTAHILGTTLGSGSVSTYVDSTTPTTQSTSFTSFTNPLDFELILPNQFIGDIGEVFCTNTKMSTSDIASAVAYLTARGY